MLSNRALMLTLLALPSLSAAAHATTTGIDPRNFVARVTNPWFPLRPGTTYVYRGVKDGEATRDVVTVTARTRVFAGVRATEVHDRLYERGRLEERTSDWYAQDKRGNVWYLGESTAELDRSGHVKSRDGSWLTGVNGARAGIYITARPRVGQSARQEYYRGHAEDHFEVLSLASSVSVPYLTSRKALLTKEWTPLEPGVLDHKYYIRGVGNVKEITVKGPTETNILVRIEARPATTVVVRRDR
jgi:hypothetical protein